MARLLPRLAVLLLTVLGAGCSSKSHDCAGVLCGGACLDPASYQTDANNCGGCGVRCGAGATCSGGLCQCPAGEDRCDALVPRCRNLQTDSGACGTCGTSCTATKPGSTCLTGVCACTGAKPDDCGTFCTDTQSDPQNCAGVGGCGHACPLAHEACSAGTCGCPPTFPTQCPTASPTACVNTTNDPANCGACGNACTRTNEICASSACACPASLPNACATACVSFASDPQNCGGCGNACPTGATCTATGCQCPAGEVPCNGACIPCAGGTCSAGACHCPAGPVAGCSGQCCAGGTSCCASGCPQQHSNGLGGSYFNCDAPYAASATTKAAALLAADSWNAVGTTFDGTTGCDPFCVGRQTGTQCAVWCYGLSPFAGRVALDASSIVCVCPTAASPTWN